MSFMNCIDYVVLQQQINTCTGCVEHFVINFKFSAIALMSQNQLNI